MKPSDLKRQPAIWGSMPPLHSRMTRPLSKSSRTMDGNGMERQSYCTQSLLIHSKDQAKVQSKDYVRSWRCWETLGVEPKTRHQDAKTSHTHVHLKPSVLWSLRESEVAHGSLLMQLEARSKSIGHHNSSQHTYYRETYQSRGA